MAEWIPPKIDYWDTPRPIGGEDLKRIEGNIAALESGVVMPKGVLLRVERSDEVILEANTQRSVYVSEGTKLVKEFVLKYPGIYRLKCEVRGSDYPSVAPKCGSVIVSVSDGSGGTLDILSTSWQSKSLEIITGLYGNVVSVSIDSNYRYVYIRNVKICGTITKEEPEYAVLRD